MESRQRGTIANASIALGVVAHLLGPGLVVLNELPGPLLAIMNRVPVPAWTVLYPLSVACFITAIAAHLFLKGYQPLKRSTFYALSLVAAIPVFGPVAALMKLHSVNPKNADREEHLAIVLNAAVIILSLVGVLYWAVLHHLFSGYHVRAAVNEHLASAQARLASALTHNPIGDRVARENELDAAENELEDALAYRAAFGRSDALRLLGDVYREQGKWTEAEESYREALAILPGDPLILSRMKEMEKRKKQARTDVPKGR